MTEITWATPPQSKRGTNSSRRSAEWESVAEALKQNPTQWALVRAETESCYGYFIKTARLVAFQPAGAYEATVRKNQDNPKKYDIYARYIGE
jgi:hypothetical protein